jgi:hypothetical protein
MTENNYDLSDKEWDDVCYDRKNPPECATPDNIQEVSKEYATFGNNPRKEQVKRLKKAINHLELAQEEMARMGAVYMEFDNERHSEYCQGLYIALEGVKSGMTTFLSHM